MFSALFKLLSPEMKALKVKAEKGSAEAQYELGLYFYYGKTVGWIDKEEGLKWLEKAAAQDFVLAKFKIALIYEEIKYPYYDVKEKIAKKQQYYLESKEAIRSLAHKGNAEAQYLWGCYHIENKHQYSLDEKVGFAFCQMAALQNHETAISELIKLQKDNRDTCAYWARMGAELGYVDLQIKLGSFYEEGFGVAKDLRQALYWYNEALKKGKYVGDLKNRFNKLSQQGFKVAKEKEGMPSFCKLEFISDAIKEPEVEIPSSSVVALNIPQNPKDDEEGLLTAILQLKLSGKAKEAETQYKISRMLYYKNGNACDIWFELAVKQDYPLAICRRMLHYYKNPEYYKYNYDIIVESLVSKFKKVLSIIIFMAKKGNVDAQDCLATCYENGWGVKKKSDFSIYWRKQAADNLNVTNIFEEGFQRESRVTIARLYEDGKKLKQDLAQAMYYFQKADSKVNVESLAKNGHQPATHPLPIPEPPNIFDMLKDFNEQDCQFLRDDKAEHKIQQISAKEPTKKLTSESKTTHKKATTIASNPSAISLVENKSQQNPNKKDPTTTLDPAALEQLIDLPQRMAQVEAKTEFLNPQILKSLTDNHPTLIKMVINENCEDKLHEAILTNEIDFDYYSMSATLFCGTQRACEGIFSSFGANGKSYKSDHVASGLDAMSSIPVIGMAAKILSTIIKGKNFTAKNNEVAHIIFFFVGAKNPENFLRQFARLLTYARQDDNIKLANKKPDKIKEKIKYQINELQNKILCDGSSNPVMAAARKDWELILEAIISEKLTAPPSYKQMLTLCVGDAKTQKTFQDNLIKHDFVLKAGPLDEFAAAQSIASQYIPKSSSSLVVLSQLQIMKEINEKERDATAREMAKMQEILLKQQEHLRQETVRREAAEQKLESLYKTISTINPDESTVVGSNGSAQLQLSRNAATHPLDAKNQEKTIAELKSNVVVLSQHVEQHGQTLANLTFHSERAKSMGSKAFAPLKPLRRKKIPSEKISETVTNTTLTVRLTT